MQTGGPNNVNMAVQPLCLPGGPNGLENSSFGMGRFHRISCNLDSALPRGGIREFWEIQLIERRYNELTVEQRYREAVPVAEQLARNVERLFGVKHQSYTVVRETLHMPITTRAWHVREMAR